MHALQQAITSGRPSLTQLLHQTHWIATRLNLEEVAQWVSLESAGYAEDTEPPGYRKVLTHSLEVYNAYQDSWQFAGHLHYALQARQPIEEIERFARGDRIDFPVAKNFSIKNNLGDSFGSDWPQRFVVVGSEYQRIIDAVVNRWATELEKLGLEVVNVEKFTAGLKDLAAA